MSFASRLVLGTVLILVLTVGILFWVAERSLRRDLEGEIGRTLESEAALVREALPGDSAGWPAAVRRLSAQTQHRITLIDRDGWVRADSDFPPGPLPALENHGGRAEVRAALGGARGVARRRRGEKHRRPHEVLVLVIDLTEQLLYPQQVESTETRDQSRHAGEQPDEGHRAEQQRHVTNDHDSRSVDGDPRQQ